MGALGLQLLTTAFPAASEGEQLGLKLVLMGMPMLQAAAKSTVLPCWSCLFNNHSEPLADKESLVPLLRTQRTHPEIWSSLELEKDPSPAEAASTCWNPWS